LEIDLSIDPKEVSTIIKEFIKTYVQNSGSEGVVIGMSGGVDSAVTAILCRAALGKKKSICLFLPDETTPKEDFKHFKILVDRFDIDYNKIDINNLVKQFNNNCLIKPDKYALANVKARVRMIFLFEYANMKHRLVCGTSNKSELLVGYFTKYGDGGVDIQPMGDLYKTQVWELAKYLKIPKEIVSKSPTAGLWHGQMDEHELKMSYKVLDRILAGLEQKIGIAEIAGIVGVKKSDVERIKKMRVKSQHKRRSPLIPKLGLRTPGLDWRSPVQEG
jgi:NAD+ synthase